MQGPNSYQRKALSNISVLGVTQISDLRAGKKVKGELLENGWIEISHGLSGREQVCITDKGQDALKLPKIPHPFGNRNVKLKVVETRLKTLPPRLAGFKK